jgi:hypothetical protein
MITFDEYDLERYLMLHRLAAGQGAYLDIFRHSGRELKILGHKFRIDFYTWTVMQTFSCCARISHTPINPMLEILKLDLTSVQSLWFILFLQLYFRLFTFEFSDN